MNMFTMAIFSGWFIVFFLLDLVISGSEICYLCRPKLLHLLCRYFAFVQIVFLFLFLSFAIVQFIGICLPHNYSVSKYSGIVILVDLSYIF